MAWWDKFAEHHAEIVESFDLEGELAREIEEDKKDSGGGISGLIRNELAEHEAGVSGGNSAGPGAGGSGGNSAATGEADGSIRARVPTTVGATIERMHAECYKAHVLGEKAPTSEADELSFQ